MGSEFFEMAIELVKQAGEIISHAFQKEKVVESKTCSKDLVTETDKQVETFLIGNLQKKFPGHRFIGEESLSKCEKCILTNDPTWIIDPIDGTMNFVHNLPFIAISVALIQNKETILGIIYNPILKQMFTAQLGKGAFLNDNVIKVSSVRDLTKSLVMFEFGTSETPEKMECVHTNMNNLISIVHGFRSLGSAALNMAMVAFGGAEAYFEFGLHCWDMAAGDLIVREAGGVVIDTSGRPLDLMSRRVLCASSIDVAKQLCPLLCQYEPERDDVDKIKYNCV